MLPQSVIILPVIVVVVEVVVDTVVLVLVEVVGTLVHAPSEHPYGQSLRLPVDIP